VHLHLEHRLVQRLLSRFLSQGFLHHELSRACVLASPDPQPKVLVLGRLSLFGQGATRLHDQLISVIADWHPGADRGAALQPLVGAQQAQAFVAMGFALGFGGTLTYERSLQLRRLASELPLSAIVLETDAPDIPPHWLYQTAEQRAQGAVQGRNSPAELPRIAQVLAQLRGVSLADLAAATTANAGRVLPQLAAL
jgi:hypothetical protein